MDCKEFVWILTNASNTIIEKKIISVFFKTKKKQKTDTLLYPNSFLLKKILYMCKMFSCYL